MKIELPIKMDSIHGKKIVHKYTKKKLVFDTSYVRGCLGISSDSYSGPRQDFGYLLMGVF